jgi:hypothetical protein
MMNDGIKNILSSQDQNLLTSLCFNLDSAIQELKKSLTDTTSPAIQHFISLWYGIYTISTNIDRIAEEKRANLENVLDDLESDKSKKELIVAQKVAEYIQKQYLFKLFDLLVSKVSSAELQQIGLFLTTKACPSLYYKELLKSLTHGLNVKSALEQMSLEDHTKDLEELQSKVRRSTMKYPECSMCMNKLDFTTIVFDGCPHSLSAFCGGASISSKAAAPCNYSCIRCPRTLQKRRIYLT